MNDLKYKELIQTDGTRWVVLTTFGGYFCGPHLVIPIEHIAHATDTELIEGMRNAIGPAMRAEADFRANEIVNMRHSPLDDRREETLQLLLLYAGASEPIDAAILKLSRANEKLLKKATEHIKRERKRIHGDA